MSYFCAEEKIENDLIENKSIMLIGMGPHAKRIYMHYLEQYNCVPKVIVDLKYKEADITDFLKLRGISSEICLIEDVERDNLELTQGTKERLLYYINKYNLKYAIIATEPKAHFAYAKFFLENKINILLDKPITSPSNCSTNEEKAKAIYDDYKQLVDLYKPLKSENISFTIQCQRRWHAGYQYIYNLVKQCVMEFQIPITYINVYHCDGMWNMPDEYLFRENHPYKYGYGKLMHSGYHFLDLVAHFLKINLQLDKKKINNCELFTAVSRPSDQLAVIDKSNYEQLFDTQKFDEVFDSKEKYAFNKFGEVDYFSTLQMFNDNELITVCELNLLQSGYSRRSWIDLPKDTYKGNGRVRHESMNIQIGPLMNIQVHSYQSKEIKDRSNRNGVGEVEHFDIYIFRNIELIGGKALEIKTIDDLETKEERGFIGYNEEARQKALLEYLEGQPSNSNILEHELSIKLLSNSYLSMARRSNNKSPIVKFNI